MGMRMPETCWAAFKRQVINLRNCCIWLVDSLESMVLHGPANPKFKCSFLLEAKWPSGYWMRTEGTGHLKTSKDPTGNQTRDFPYCDAMSQPTAGRVGNVACIKNEGLMNYWRIVVRFPERVEIIPSSPVCLSALDPTRPPLLSLQGGRGQNARNVKLSKIALKSRNLYLHICSLFMSSRHAACVSTVLD